jgi:hypothetical protein
MLLDTRLQRREVTYLRGNGVHPIRHCDNLPGSEAPAGQGWRQGQRGGSRSCSVARAKFALMKLSNDVNQPITGELVEKYRVEALKRGYPVW